ncbi:iron ABC transporter permease [Escherichia coli]
MRTVNGCILLLAAISITFAAVSGAYHLDMQQLLALILRQENVPVQEQIVFWQIRVPRILAALFLGAALAGAGTTYQGMFRNPLVSPDILGVSAGAGLGACAAILWGLSIVYIQLYAFCGGLMVVAGVWLITRRVTRHDPILALVLVGIALGTLCGAGISLIKMFFLRWRMNLLTLSDDEARSLGLNVTRLRFGLIVCATLITASTVAIAGIIGWVGLVVPHIARLLTGHNHQQLLPIAMCTGAILLLLTDTLARSIGTTEIPLGILTAFVGAPFFLLLLLRGGRQ